MVKLKELRIANLVTDEFFESCKKLITVESINDKGINLTITDDGNWSELAQHFITPEYEFKQLRGIPLSEEILLNLDNKNESFSVHKNGITVFKNMYEHNFLKEDYVYLHQLQNLYSDLTGEELNTSKLI